MLADFTGLTVDKMTVFRADCRKGEIGCRVVKNRLARRAATAAELGNLDELFSGPTAIAFGFESPVEPAKVLAEFAVSGDLDPVGLERLADAS